MCYSEDSNRISPKSAAIAALFVFLKRFARVRARGELAELAFMRKAASRGFAVSKPWGDCERYDFVVRVGKLFWRVQVKSVRAKAPQRPHYCLVTTNSHKIPYSSEDIDFLVAYVFPEDAWYVFPATVVENRKTLCINPNSKRTRLEKFREAWKLMEQTDVAQNTAQSGVEQTAIQQTGTEPK